ncbi:MAG: M14 family metallocarboxypeptidase [Opitutaceae bacterium]|nr:M14 family metallocarboxypeptidase [Opitutaceae bacterium]
MNPENTTTASVLNPLEFARQIEPSARAAGFHVERFCEMAGCPILALTRRTAGPRPRIYISAGIHGDEPAPPLALLEMIEAGVFDDRAVWFICPLLNPAGFIRRTRENADGIDLNRDYKALRSLEIQAHAQWLRRQPNFDLALCLHEDWEAQGFYLYELNAGPRGSLASQILDAVRQVCPLETATVIDGREVSEPAIIRPIGDPVLRETWPESIYLRAHHTRHEYTLETPSALPLAVRISAHSAAVTTALTALGEPPRNMSRNA